MTTVAIPVRNALGYAEFLWSCRQLFMRRKSSQWAQALGTVEGYEFLSANQNGWLVVFYSYEIDGKPFAGEWRRWLLFGPSSIETATEKITSRLPVGAKIELRVDPSNPSRSIACL